MNRLKKYTLILILLVVSYLSIVFLMISYTMVDEFCFWNNCILNGPNPVCYLIGYDGTGC